MLLLVCLNGLLVLSGPPPAHAQAASDSLPRASSAAAAPLAAFAAQRARLDRRGLAVLSAWAAGNLLVGGVATAQTEGSAHYFHQMNVGWGAVNLALAGTGYLAARRAARQPPADRTGNVRAQLRTENLYLFNAGLDVAYLATGLYLLEKGRNPATSSPERWQGYGQSLLLQGGFLLLFDGLQFAAHHRHGRGLYPLLGRVSAGPGGVGMTLMLGSGSRSLDHPTP